MKTLLQALAIIIATVSAAFAQQTSTPVVVSPTTTTTTIPTTTPAPVIAAPDSFPAIASSGIIRAEAFRNARGVRGSIYAPSTVNDGSDEITWVGQKSPKEILASLAKLKLGNATFNSGELVTVYVAVMDNDGNNLIYGYTQTKPVQVNGKWVLPASAGNIDLILAPYAMDMLKPVAYASTMNTDANGYTSEYPLAVNGNKVLFPVESAGLPNAYVRVVFTDGSVAAYYIGTGKSGQLYALDTVINPKLANFFSYENTTAVNLTVKTEKGGYGFVPTLTIATATGSNGFVTVDVVTSEGFRPTRYLLKNVKLENAGWLTATASAGSGTLIGFAPGETYYVVPEFAQNTLHEPSYPVSNGGGTKGG